MVQGKSTPAPKKKPSLYSDFEGAKERILTALRSGVFYATLTGPSGSGKTSLLREVAASLDRHRFQVHYLAQANPSSAGVGRFLADILHLSPRKSHTETLRAIAQALKALPFRILLFVDEAHLLCEDTLQEIRLLSESELDSPPLFGVLFSGLTELKAKLDSQRLFPLKRRLLLRLELNGLKEDEVVPFLESRLGKAEASRLPQEVTSALFERARGIPAFLESLARACLESSPGKETISLENCHEVLESWDLA